VPRDVTVLDKMPLLGSGKIDYPAVQRLIASESERPEAATVA
jgi:hypothetical protein